MTVGELQKQNYENPHPLAIEDFFVLLQFVTKQSKTFLLAHPEHTLSLDECKSFTVLKNKRFQHCPIAYLTGSKEFYGRDFLVSSATLIPRPETEILVELVLQAVEKSTKKIAFYDIGTGSGAIILTLAKELISNTSRFTFTGIDISESALLIAQKNKVFHQIDFVTFRKGDLLQDCLIDTVSDQEIFLIANLPYVPEKDYRESEPDVRDYEPVTALVSGVDGLDHYRRFIEELHQKNLPHAHLFLEIDSSQGEAIQTLLYTHFPHITLQLHSDLAGHPRVIEASY